MLALLVGAGLTVNPIPSEATKSGKRASIIIKALQLTTKSGAPIVAQLFDSTEFNR